MWDGYKFNTSGIVLHINYQRWILILILVLFRQQLFGEEFLKILDADIGLRFPIANRCLHRQFIFE